MGLGKTFQAISAFSALDFKTALIICPSTVKLGWRDEFADVGVTDVGVIESGKTICGASIHVVNYDMVINGRIKPLHYFRPDVLILDEIHKLKAMDSSRTQEILGVDGWAHKAKYIWGLTGTPLPNRPVELFPILKTLYPKALGEYKTYEKYAYRYCGGHFDGHGLDAKGASHLDELAAQMSGFMLRRTQKEVLPELPQCITTIVRLERTAEYAALDQVELNILSRTTKESYINEKMSQLGDVALLCKATALAKLPQVIEHIQLRLETGEKVVVFVHHREIGDRIAEALPAYKPVFVRGGQTSDQRRSAVEAFQGHDSQLLVGNIVAAGTGLDGLQKVCHHIIFAEESWCPGDVTQAVCRLVRMGQEFMVTVEHLVGDGTIEDAMVQVRGRKSLGIGRVLTRPPTPDVLGLRRFPQSAGK